MITTVSVPVHALYTLEDALLGQFQLSLVFIVSDVFQKPAINVEKHIPILDDVDGWQAKYIAEEEVDDVVVEPTPSCSQVQERVSEVMWKGNTTPLLRTPVSGVLQTITSMIIFESD